VAGRRAQADRLAADGDPGAAARLCETYDGPHAASTGKERNAMAEAFRTQARRRAEARRAEAERLKETRKTTIASAAERLLDMDIDAARTLVLNTRADPAMAAYDSDWIEILRLLDVAASLELRILASFNAERGQKVVVHLAKGVEELYIRAVSDNMVHAERLVRVSAGHLRQNATFGVQDLAMKEKRARVGKDESADTALLHGLLSVQSQAYPSARKYLGRTGPVFAESLVAALDRKRLAALEATAQRSLARLIGLMGVEIAEYDREYWLAAVAGARLTEDQVTALHGHVRTYRDRYGHAQFAREAEPILQALTRVRPATPESRTDTAMSPVQVLLFKRAVLPLSPDEQLLELKRKLVLQNPGIRTERVVFTPAPDGSIVQVELIDSALRDIGPLAALPALRDLNCGPAAVLRRGRRNERCALRSLYPLRDLDLNVLRCEGNRVTDLAPLAGMPLVQLFLAYTDVQDLSPLSGMSLRVLRLTATKVKDLTALRGMPLERLIVAQTPLSRLEPLEGMPLKLLDASQTLVDNLAPLRGMPLQGLLLENTYVEDLTPLTGMPLRRLNIRDTPVRDFGPLKGMPVEDLWLDFPDDSRELLDSLSKLRRLNGKPYERE
jgi:hypothetical protein